jgi:hypothetical protein
MTSTHFCHNTTYHVQESEFMFFLNFTICTPSFPFFYTTQILLRALLKKKKKKKQVKSYKVQDYSQISKMNPGNLSVEPTHASFQRVFFFFFGI